MLYAVAGRRLCGRLPGVGLPAVRLERHGSVIGYVMFTSTRLGFVVVVAHDGVVLGH